MKKEIQAWIIMGGLMSLPILIPGILLLITILIIK